MKQKPISLSEVEDAANALSAWRADDRDEWIRVGMAINSFDDSEMGFEIFEKFSQQSEKFQPKSVHSVWRSFKSNGGGKVGIGSLFQMAADDGWDNPRKKSDECTNKSNGTGSAGNTARTKESADQKAEKKKNGSEAKKPRYLWKSKKTALTMIDSLISAAADPGTKDYLNAEYGIDRVPRS